MRTWSRLRSRTTWTRSRPAGLIKPDWQKRLAAEQLALHVHDRVSRRKGNPKGIKDWNDLVKPGVQIITPNPKTSGGARWNYLAAWGYALKQPGGNDAKANEFVAQLSSRCRCSTRARAARRRRSSSAGSATCCWPGKTKRTWRSTKPRTRSRSSSRRSASWPSRRSRWWTRWWTARGTRAVAEAYLQYLYTPEGQEIAAKHHYRPRDEKVAAKYASSFAKVKLFTVDDTFGGWQNAQKTHFVRRRHLRPDLPAGRALVHKVADPAGLQGDDGVHGVLSVPHRPWPAADAAGEGRVARVGAVLGGHQRSEGRRVVPRHARIVAGGGVYQRRVRVSRGVGARALRVSRPATRRRAD